MASLVSMTSAAAWSVIGNVDLIVRGEGSGLMSMTCWLSSGRCMVLPFHLGAAFLSILRKRDSDLKHNKHSQFKEKCPPKWEQKMAEAFRDFSVSWLCLTSLECPCYVAFPH
jgi:hypothetical protein